jgi:predicted dehydrogenase
VTRALLVGLGEVGQQHLDALTRTPGVHIVGIVEPRPLPPTVAVGLPRFAEHRAALAALSPDLVVVAIPPVISLPIAREAAATGARVLVEKPVVIDPADLDPPPGAGADDEAISVAFQPHFAPGLADLLTARPTIARATVVLAWRRDAAYYRGWRATWSSAGGVLHQQAIHGLALALRLLDSPAPVTCVGHRHHRRGLSDAEDQVAATLTLAGGVPLRLDCRVDHPGPPYHHMHLDLVDGRRLSITGRNLEAGLGTAHRAPTHRDLRIALYQALLATSPAVPGGPRQHPCLFPLRALCPVLEVIDCVYRTVSRCRPAA